MLIRQTSSFPFGMRITIKAIEESEIAVEKTINDKEFEPLLYSPDVCRCEQFGAGMMGETSTRVVRTVFDAASADYSNMVLGEVINYPGKVHPQVSAPGYAMYYI